MISKKTKKTTVSRAAWSFENFSSYTSVLKYSIHLLLFVFICLNFQSCSSKKFLQRDQYFLDKNSIVMKAKIENKTDVLYELEAFYKQKPNTNYLLVFPRERVYYKIKKKNKDTKFNRWLLKSIAEKPSIYSDSLTNSAAKDMQKYLRYKGYLNAKVIPQRYPRGKKMKVTYYVLPSEQFKVDSVFFHSDDPKVDKLLQAAAKDCLFEEDEALNLSLFANEKLRITNILKNRGYAEFYPAHIDDLELDTFQNKNKANLYINILPPYGDSLHKQFFIGDIDIFQDYSAGNTQIIGDTIIGGINFHLTNKGFIINPSTFRKAISLRFGELYSQRAYDKTHDQLTELGIFRFVRIKPIRDSLVDNVMHYNILLTPYPKMEFSANLDVNYTNRSLSTVTNNLIGLSLGPNFVNRNLSGGAELFSMNLHAGLEVAPSKVGQSEFWNTVDIGADFDFTLPRFVDYLGIWKTLYRISPRSKNRSKVPLYINLRNNAHTRISTSYNYLKIINLYRYNLLSASYGYDYQLNKTTKVAVNHLSLNYLRPVTEPAFDSILKDNGFLQRSFGQQFFISLLFRNIDFTKRSSGLRRGKSYYFNVNFETAGGEIHAIKKLYNSLGSSTDSLKKVSQYVRLETEYRFLQKISEHHDVAARLNIGIARPFGITSDVPFVKQYFVGGANSMRAWSPRSLGPGGYVNPDSTLFLPENSFKLFQTGDLKLEFNLEYRFPLFWTMDLAAFLDVGNVWTVKRDDERPGSHFLFRSTQYEITENGETKTYYHYPFYKQIAVNSGLGLRVDLSYFVFRFDVGVKLRNPFPEENVANPSESSFWNRISDLERGDFGYNFGLGFPF